VLEYTPLIYLVAAELGRKNKEPNYYYYYYHYYCLYYYLYYYYHRRHNYYYFHLYSQYIVYLRYY
jgi:hypothetical protein